VPARAAIAGSAGVSARSVTVVGCLVRQTSAGGALTAQPAERGDVLALTRVSMTPTSAAPVSAVPGSAPSGSGSGTIANPPAPASVPDTSPERSIAIDAAHEGEIAGLAKYVGQRVEISGTVQDVSSTATARADDAARRSPGGVGTTGSAEAPAHTSAPAERITMISFRPVGGTCN
jgi:hypothetical protein